jgi:hypothetical protein
MGTASRSLAAAENRREVHQFSQILIDCQSALRASGGSWPPLTSKVWRCRFSREVLDCAGRAERRRRFRMARGVRERINAREKSGVASDLPPQSKMLTRERKRLGASWP